MCGIGGIHAYHYAANPVDRDELTRVRERMRGRGPDADGLWISTDGRVGLAHRRLAIIDLDARANQPMHDADAGLSITYNGEIYNHAALRRELEAEGCAFRTKSDTEVLLALYRRRGVEMFGALRGMYAFALWDARAETLLLARDPYGIKPLYYADDGWTLRFASQAKALLAGGKVSREIDPAGVVGFHLLGSVPEPWTLHRAIRAVPAGSYVRVDHLGPHAPVAHFSIAGTWARAAASSSTDPRESAAAIREALLDSVRDHLVADVPVGAFLSSGIDSAALVGLMRDAGQERIRTVTVAFDEFRGSPEDEAPLAEQVARTYGTDHVTRRVGAAEFAEDLPRILDAMDQPSIDGINTWFAAKAIAEQGLKVAMSGLGADELFGGYPSFRDVPRWSAALRWPSRIPGAGALFRRVAPLLVPGLSPKGAGLLELGGTPGGAWFLKRGLFMPWELGELLGAEIAREGLRRLAPAQFFDAALAPDPGHDFARVSTLESAFYMRNQLLRDTDWASMAHSIEVRVPYVDARLLATAAGRLAHKDAVAASPRVPLPESVVRRPKTGFGTPVSRWLEQGTMAEWRAVPRLTQARCPWARRWSHVVAVRSGAVAA